MHYKYFIDQCLAYPHSKTRGSSLIITLALLLILTPLALGSMYRLQYQSQTLYALDNKRRLQTEVRQQLVLAAAIAQTLPANISVANSNWQITALANTASTQTISYFQLSGQVENASGRVTAHALYRRGIDPAIRMFQFAQ